MKVSFSCGELTVYIYFFDASSRSVVVVDGEKKWACHFLPTTPLARKGPNSTSFA